MQIPSCGFNCADSFVGSRCGIASCKLHRAGCILRIASCGLHRTDDFMQMASCGPHCVDFPVGSHRAIVLCKSQEQIRSAQFPMRLRSADNVVTLQKRRD